MSPRLDRHTPSITSTDGRGLMLRQVGYWRRDRDDVAVARVSHAEYDVAGRLVAQRDPRLLASAQRANLLTVYSLSGAALSSDSVDAGWRLSLSGEAQQLLESWDGRGTHGRCDYDAQLRPVALYESAPGQPPQTVERMTYANNAAEFAARNQCGQLLRHDDPAGTLLFYQQALTGQVISQTRRFLPAEHTADWPEGEAARNALPEPDKRYDTLQRYSPAGELIEQTDAGEHQQHWRFDRAGQLSAIDLTLKGLSAQPLLSGVEYNAEGQLVSQVAGNNVITVAAFEPSTGRLQSLSAAASGKGLLQDLRYEYDPVGNIGLLADHAQPERHFANQRVVPQNTYTYDSLYQLTRATGREAVGASIRPGLPELVSPVDPSLLLNYTQEYDYDAGGNFTVLRHIRAGNNYTRTMRVADTSNRALPWEEGAALPEFDRQFDANGNLQTLVPGAQPMRWDRRNQLQQLTTVNRDSAANDGEVYRYDSSGARVRKVSTALAKTVAHQREVRYLPGLEIRTLDTSEELQVISVALGRGSVRCLHWVTGKPTTIEADQLRYSVDDHLGSSSLELDKNAAVISHEGYYPYGGTAWWAARSQVEASYKTIRYSGKEQDASGLVYYGLRYLAPWLGRWANPDPLGDVDGLNVYRMVRNNPIRFLDDTGGNPTEVAIEMNTPPLSPTASTSMSALDEAPSFARYTSMVIENLKFRRDPRVPPPMPDSWEVWRNDWANTEFSWTSFKSGVKNQLLPIVNSRLGLIAFPTGGATPAVSAIASLVGIALSPMLTNELHPNPGATPYMHIPGMPVDSEGIFQRTQEIAQIHNRYVTAATVAGASLGPLSMLINSYVDELRGTPEKAAKKAEAADLMTNLSQTILEWQMQPVGSLSEHQQNTLIQQILRMESLSSISPRSVRMLEQTRALGPHFGYSEEPFVGPNETITNEDFESSTPPAPVARKRNLPRQ